MVIGSFPQNFIRRIQPQAIIHYAVAAVLFMKTDYGTFELKVHKTY